MSKKLTIVEFNKLPRSEKKILIAKDVLKNINSKKYIARGGDYLMFPNLQITTDSVRDNFNKIKECYVCALGACLLSTIKYKNKLLFRDIISIRSYDEQWDILKGVFSSKELANIEYCFEGNNVGTRVAEDRFNLTENNEIARIGIVYSDKFYNNSRNIITKIMKNIIRNNGNFKPKQDL